MDWPCPRVFEFLKVLLICALLGVFCLWRFAAFCSLSHWEM